MPLQDSYGRILRDAREREGFDLTTMARRLHIRPDILKAIEDADFGRMPASGYTRNMIRAYARAVGLDQKRISEMYLDASHLYETGRPRAGSSSRPQRTSSGRGARERSEGRSSGRPPARSQSVSRSLPDRSSRSRSSARGLGYVGQPQGSGRRASAPPARTSYGTLYGGGQGGRQIPGLALWIGLAVVAVILIIVLIVLFNSGKQAVEDVPDIPISGLTDTSNPEGVVSADVVDTPPEKAVFTFSVESGQSSWIQITEDGSTVLSEVVRGPFEESYDVTGTLTLRTANPSPVSVEVDGVEGQLTKESSSDYYAYTVDFQAILDAWEEEHPQAGKASSSSSSSSSSSASTSSSSSSSSNSSASRSSSSSSGSASQ